MDKRTNNDLHNITNKTKDREIRQCGIFFYIFFFIYWSVFIQSRAFMLGIQIMLIEMEFK
jgi:hypothetical protein